MIGGIDLDARTPFAGRYRVIRRIAAGGMGAVFEVEHIETQRRRALKVMLPELVSNQELRDRFQMEARVTARVDSEYIVDVFDAGVDATTGMPFLVMELLQGEELGDVLKRVGAVPAQNAVAYLRQVASALDKTHSAAIVHRDLKPENLFLTHREDGTPRIKILDFGISKVVNEVSTGANATRSLGTPLYMAPEQVLGQPVSPATDLYSLGLIAFTLLVGVPYWQVDAEKFDNAIAFVLHVTKGTPESAVARAARFGRTLPPAFDAWFQRATHLEPARRFQRASELVHELAILLGVQGQAAGPGLAASAHVDPQTPTASAISAPLSVGTAPGTGFDRQGTFPGAPSKGRKLGWLVAIGVIGLGAVAGATVLKMRRPAAEAPSATGSPAGPQTALPSAAPPTPPVVDVPAAGASVAPAKSVAVSAALPATPHPNEIAKPSAAASRPKGKTQAPAAMTSAKPAPTPPVAAAAPAQPPVAAPRAPAPPTYTRD